MWWGIDERFYSDTETEDGEGEEEKEELLKNEMNVDVTQCLFHRLGLTIPFAL